MIIKMLPQVRDERKIWYEIEQDKITIEIGDASDTFDFSNVPDGELKLEDDLGNSLIESELPEIPLRRVEKVDGELFVETLFTINSSEKDDRLLFPEPMTVEEFNSLMAELKDRPEEVEGDGEIPMEIN